MLRTDMRMVEVCPAATARCPHCMCVWVGRITARMDYTVAYCVNRLPRAGSCSRYSLLIPLAGDRVRVVELSTAEAVAVRANPKRTITEWLQLLDVTN